MRAASQLPGKGPTDVDDAPAPARKSKIRLWYDDDDFMLKTFVKNLLLLNK